MESAVVCPICEVEINEEERSCPYCGEELIRQNAMEVKDGKERQGKRS